MEKFPKIFLAQKAVSAEEEARSHVQLLYQAAQALPYIRPGTYDALAQANDHKNVLVSLDHLQPTSPAMVTKRARPLHGTTWCTSFLCVSWPPAVPHHPPYQPFFSGRGVPMQWRRRESTLRSSMTLYGGIQKTKVLLGGHQSLL